MKTATSACNLRTFRALARWWLGWLWCCLWAASCLPGQEACPHAAVDITYAYSTTCGGVAEAKSGAWRWSIEAGSERTSAIEAALKRQLVEQGFAVQALRFRWQPSGCAALTQPDGALTAASIERLVLEPPPDDDGTLRRLLVCRPTGSPSDASLQKPTLLACYVGNTTQVGCTIKLDPP